MDFLDENCEIFVWLPYWSLRTAMDKIAKELEEKGWELFRITEIMPYDRHIKRIREAKKGRNFAHHEAIYFTLAKDVLKISVDLLGPEKDEASQIIRQTLGEFDISFKNEDEAVREIFSIPLNKVGELFVEYQHRKGYSFNPKSTSYRKLEPELIVEIERLKRSGQIFEMSFELMHFSDELTQRFGNRLQDFVNRHLQEKS